MRMRLIPNPNKKKEGLAEKFYYAKKHPSNLPCQEGGKDAFIAESNSYAMLQAILLKHYLRQLSFI
jgi:hypothetical protein